MIKKAVFYGAVIFACVCFNAAYAAHPLITDDTGTQGKGKFQLELNGEYAYEDEEGVKEKTKQVATIISYGFIDNADVVLSVPYLHVKVEDSTVPATYSEEGIGDSVLEIKWRFFEKKGFSLALKPGISFPTGDEDKGLGAGKVAYSTYLIATKELKPFIVHVNLGHIRNENTADEKEDLWHTSIACEYEATEKLKLVANTGIETNPDATSHTHPSFLLGGVIYIVNESFAFNCGYKYGLNRPETDHSYLAGIVVRF